MSKPKRDKKKFCHDPDQCYLGAFYHYGTGVEKEEVERMKSYRIINKSMLVFVIRMEEELKKMKLNE